MVKEKKSIPKQYSMYICSFHKKEIFSHMDCFKCSQPHHDFPRYVACKHIKLKTNPAFNVTLPKDYKFKPFIFEGKTLLIERTGGGLGDLLTITVAIKELKRQFPSAYVIFKVSPQYKPVLENNPYVDDIVGLDEDIEKDVLISYSKPCPAGAYESFHNRSIFKSRVDIFCEYLGFSPTDKKPVFCLRDKEKLEGLEFFKKHKALTKKKVGIALAAAEIWVSWTREGNIELIKLLAEKGYVPVVFTMKTQEPVRIDGAIDVHDEPIRKVASVLNCCDVAITQDGGMMHLAAALGIPQICLLGPTDPKCRVSMYKGGHHIVKHEGVCPLGYDDDKFCWYYSECIPKNPTKVVPPCLTAIRAEDVLEKIGEIV